MITKSHFTVLTTSAAVVGLSLLSAGAAQANMVLNGDFSVNAASYTSFPGYSTSPNPTTPTDWLVSAPANAGVNGPDTGFYANAINGGEPFAPGSSTGVNDFAFMQGGQLYQIVATTAGQAYQLTYEAGARSGTPSTMNTIAWDNVNNAVIVEQQPSLSDANFAPYTLDFTAASRSTQVVFQDTGGTPDVSNVSLTPIPDSATLGLVMAGGLGLLLLKRRKAV
ncbi:MAG: LPXTG cell wall anchor domain-containing protein [Phycisphaerae bacterium]